MPSDGKTLMCWSGGKDSAMALYEIRRAGGPDVAALLTTMTRDYDRVSMHGVRRELLERQASSLGLPLRKVYITKDAGNEEYEREMESALRDYRGEGVGQVAFGDIFLEDLRKYRENNLSRLSLRGIFPIWKRDTVELAETFINLGFKAIVVCVDTRALDESFAGKVIDKDFLGRLPSHVDPCGENGEFHSFVYEGPIFKNPVAVRPGEAARRDDRFCFADLLPAGGSA